MRQGITLVVVGALVVGSGWSCGGGDAEVESPEATSTSAPALPNPIGAADAERVSLGDRLIRELTLPAPDWMVSGFGSLWVKLDTGVVERIDPARGKVVAEISLGPTGPHLCQGLGVSEHAIWACPRQGEITRIDPQANSVAAPLRIDKFPDQGRLVSAAGKLWVLTDGGNSVTGVDLESQKPDEPIELPGGCGDLVADGDTLWAVCPFDDVVLRLDAAAGRITGELGLPGAQTASASDDLWVGFDDGVAQIDSESLEVTAVYDVHPAYGGSIFARPDVVWVREPQGRFLTRIDPVERSIVETIEAPKLPSGGDVIVIGDSVWATASDDQALVQLRATED